ncbi:TetR/AcrR family transcriptional regulator [Beijerinckia sp. L45]|uniref:TetR/AcrR family transcriptional regulator n=1 Tax=Beijerinckia sp. L45 TaxID=1641855 RepID=UPI00131AF47E|nr:TetR/AcrR family transcriptional regulator [Beijerinckia sp. L45]
MIVSDRARCGGRSARIQASVHQAVKDLLVAVERADLTVPLIATRAGVTPSTIYRRWGDLAGLLADVAVDRLRPALDPIDTGALETDLQAWVEQYTEEMSSGPGRALIRDVLSNAPDATHAGRCSGYTTAQLQIIGDRAIARQGVALDVERVVDHVVAPIMYRILFGDAPPNLAYCHALIERALADTAPLPARLRCRLADPRAPDSDAPDGSRRSDLRAPA